MLRTLAVHPYRRPNLNLAQLSSPSSLPLDIFQFYIAQVQNSRTVDLRCGPAQGNGMVSGSNAVQLVGDQRPRFSRLAAKFFSEYGEPFARLVPDIERVCVGRDLAEALTKTNLPESEARAWHRDLKAARRALKAPADKWR